MIHELKILPEYYNAVKSGKKKFELRKDDRGFAEGDSLRLNKWTPNGGYTGETIITDITYILRGHMDDREAMIKPVGISFWHGRRET